MSLQRSFLTLILLLLLATLPSMAQKNHTWRTFGNLAQPRALFCALDIGNGRVLVMGGYAMINGELVNVPTQSCEVIDLRTGTITQTAPMGVPRAFFAALLTPDSNVVAIGGDNAEDLHRGTVTSAVELFDRATMSWRILGHLRFARYQHVATFINDHEILVVGGRHGSGNTMSECEIFDVTTGTSRLVASFPVPTNGAMLDMSSDGVPTLVGYRTGGANSDRSRAVFSYDVAANAWKETGQINEAVQKPELLKLWDGRLLIVGGSKTDGPLACSGNVTLEDWDGGWRLLGNMSEARLWSGVAQFNSDSVLILGGYNNGEIAVPTVDWVNIRTGAITPGPRLIAARKYFTAVSVPVTWGEVGPTGATVVAISGYAPDNKWVSSVEVLAADCFAEVVPNGEIDPGEQYQLWTIAPQGSTYNWRPSIGLSCTDCAEPVAKPAVTTTYIVTVTNPSGCVTVDTVTVHVKAPARVAMEESVSSADGLVGFEGSGDDLRFTLARAADVTIEVYTPAGERVATIFDGAAEAGSHRLEWSGAGLAGGVYFLRIRAGGSVAVKRIMN